MCGGVYEEELDELTYYGPSTEFRSTPVFGRAVGVCELENISCRIDPYTNRIHFKNTKEEEKFTIAWSKTWKKR